MSRGLGDVYKRQVGAWVAVQVASSIFPGIGVPESAIRYVWIAAVLLFPVAIVFAWFFELTADGLKRTPPTLASDAVDLSLRRTDFVILAALGVVAGGVAWQLSSDIRAVTDDGQVVVRGEIDPNSIAVLPLENLSGDPEQQYFVSGMHDALVSGLSRIRALKVTSKTSTMRYAGLAQPLPRIATELGVAKLIEGSVYRVGEQVRISVKLLDAANDEQIWSDVFEDDIRDVLRLQREVAEAIAEAVHVVVTDVDAAGQVDPAAYEAFLKGQFHVERFTPQDMAAAHAYYQQAVELDPDYALAYYGLSKLCAFQAQAGVISPSQARENCLPPISKALALAPDLPEAHMGYAGHMTWQRYDWEEAEKGFQRALELNPSYAEARLFYAHFLGIMGRREESIEQANRAIELDPMNPFTQGLYGAQHWVIGDTDGAIEIIEHTMATNPGFGFGFDVLWAAYHETGDLDKAQAALVGLLRMSGEDHVGVRTLEDQLTRGSYLAALIPTAEAIVANQEAAPIMPTTIGMMFEYGGDIDRALDWYEIAYETGSPDAPYLVSAKGSTGARSSPRFIRLLREMKLDYWADRYESGS